MKTAARFLRELGLLLALGSILTCVVMNAVVGSSPDAVLIHHERLFVSAISRALTVPGVLVLVCAESVAAFDARRHLWANGWLIARFVLSVLILFDTMVLIAPLVSHVTALAEAGAVQGHALGSYAALKKIEDAYGTANFVMLTVSALLGTFAPVARPFN